MMVVISFSCHLCYFHLEAKNSNWKHVTEHEPTCVHIQINSI